MSEKQGPAILLHRLNAGEVLNDTELENLIKYVKGKKENPKRDTISIDREIAEKMANQPIYIPVTACQDDSCHWYVIPAEKGEEFSRLLDGGVKTEDEFIEKFSEYMTGGDLNLTQLYMKVETVEESHWNKFPDPLEEEKPAITQKDGKTFVFGDELRPVSPPINGREFTPGELLNNMLANADPSMVETVIMPAIADFIKGGKPRTFDKKEPETPGNISPITDKDKCGGPKGVLLETDNPIFFHPEMPIQQLFPFNSGAQNVDNTISIDSIKNAVESISANREDKFQPHFPRFLDHADTTKIMVDKLAEIAEKFAIENKDQSALEMVEEFHQAFDIPVYVSPTLPTYLKAYEEIEDLMAALEYRFKNRKCNSRTFLRMKLIFEEFKEMCEAMRDGRMDKILDGLCDLLYTVYGTAHEFGLGPVLKPGFREVHRSNMSKLGADGKPVLREDGKVLKGPNFSPPDLARIIEKANTTQKDIDEINHMLRNNTVSFHDPNIYPDWNAKAWQEAIEKAKERPLPDTLVTILDNIDFKSTLGPLLGKGLPDIPGMPEPTNEGVIYSDLKVGDVTQGEDGTINVEINATRHTPVESIRATIEFKQPNDAYELQVTEEQPPADDQY